MAVSYDEYIKRGVGQFDPEYAAHLYQKENYQEVTQLQTRNSLVRLAQSHPWVVLGCVAFAMFSLGANWQSPKVQTFQAPAPTSHTAPYIINNVVK